MARALIVEDTEANRYVTASWLRRAGYEVIEAATGQEALRLVGPETDVVVLDVHLPDLSGLSVCAAIKGTPVTSGVPVMHLSATAVDPTSRARGLDGGADAYLTEPVDPEEFLAVTRTLVRGREARRAADALIDRLGRLAAAALPLNSADTVPRLLEAAVVGAADVFDTAALAVADIGTGQATRALSTGRGDQPHAEQFVEGLTTVWQSLPGVLHAKDVPTAWRPLLERAELAPDAWFVAPFFAHLGVGGGLAVALGSADAPVSEERARVARQLAEPVGVALCNLRAFAEEHRIALTLQRALLPEQLPQIPGLAIAARYLAASDNLSVGGDFYDAFELPDGKTAVVIGDVRGHSLRAATVMAELRHALRAYLLEGHSPTEVLGLLDALLVRGHPEETATMVVLVVEQDLTHAVVANAGHIPPLLASCHGVTLVEEHGPLLGLAGVERSSVRVPLHDGTLLVLVTDGLLERRTAVLDEQLREMADVIAAVRELDEDRIADALLERFAGNADDDIAVLLLRRLPR